MNKPPQRFERGERIEYYDKTFERFGKGWQRAEVTEPLREIPGRSEPVWIMSFSMLIGDEVSSTQHAIVIGKDGWPENSKIRKETDADYGSG